VKFEAHLLAGIVPKQDTGYFGTNISIVEVFARPAAD
jgi:hypothetical protein